MIGITTPVLITSVIEGAEPASIQFRVPLRSDLDAAKKGGQAIFRLGVEGIARGLGRLA